MKNLFAIAILALTMGSANATQPKPETNSPRGAMTVAQPGSVSVSGATALGMSSNSNSNTNSASTSTSNTINSSNQQGGQVNEGNNTALNIETKIRQAANSAVAAGLATSNGTCMGSSSGGAQGMSFGLSIGSTWTDKNCDRRYNSMRLQQLGNQKAAVTIMCQDESVRDAMDDAGTPCPPSKRKNLAAAEPQRFEAPRD